MQGATLNRFPFTSTVNGLVLGYWVLNRLVRERTDIVPAEYTDTRAQGGPSQAVGTRTGLINPRRRIVAVHSWTVTFVGGQGNPLCSQVERFNFLLDSMSYISN
jgi:hypothetical protein